MECIREWWTALVMVMLCSLLAVSSLDACAGNTTKTSGESRTKGLISAGSFSSSGILNPTGPIGLGTGMSGVTPDTFAVSGSMFPNIFSGIPNLKVDYSYIFGPKVRVGVGRLDYVMPVPLGQNGSVFGQVHSEAYGYWQRGTLGSKAPLGFGTENKRIDVSVGGGYRKIFRNGSFVGVNGFSDNAYLGGEWFSSAGLGAEFYAITPGDGLIDISLNYYGNLWRKQEHLNAFRNGPGNYDVEIGYSHPLFYRTLDLRLHSGWYQFDTGTRLRGGRFGATVTSRDGMFSAHYGFASDQLNGSYSNVGAAVNVGFDITKLCNLQNPFSLPTPVFSSPRNISRSLSEGVKRNWHQPGAVVKRCREQSQENTSGPVTLTSISGQNIPDGLDLSYKNPGAPVSNTITVSDAPSTVSKIIVTVNISHTFVSDLHISLTSPSGTTIYLWYEEDYGEDNILSTFDDSAARSITSVDALDAPFAGTYQPRDPLSTFNGQTANGSWTLTVQDFAQDDTGVFNSWSLHIE